MIINWFVMNYKKTFKVQNKNLWHQECIGWIFISYHRTAHISCTLMSTVCCTHFKGLRTVWVESKFTTPKGCCYSNQVLDTQIVWVVSVKEQNSRIESSTKFSKLRGNQPKRNRPKHLFCFFPADDAEHHPIISKNLHNILQCMLFQI